EGGALTVNVMAFPHPVVTIRNPFGLFNTHSSVHGEQHLVGGASHLRLRDSAGTRLIEDGSESLGRLLHTPAFTGRQIQLLGDGFPGGVVDPDDLAGAFLRSGRHYDFLSFVAESQLLGGSASHSRSDWAVPVAGVLR